MGALLLLVVSVPGYVLIAHDDPPMGDLVDPTLQGLGMAALVNAFFAPSGLCAALAVYNIHKRKKSGWTLAVIAFAINLLFCTPLGVYGLVAFLRREVRDAFMR